MFYQKFVVLDLKTFNLMCSFFYQFCVKILEHICFLLDSDLVNDLEDDHIFFKGEPMIFYSYLILLLLSFSINQ